MPIRIAINGFGRIGRNVCRIASSRAEIELVAVNDLADSATLAHLLQYDSVMRRFGEPVEASGTGLVVSGRPIPVFREDDPARLPWRELSVDLVLESTGRFTQADEARRHLDAGARRVVISAPADGADVTLVLGVNEERFDPERHSVISNASCTTNCLAPILKALHEAFGVGEGFVTTVHSYTRDQSLLDHPHTDLRRARAAALSIIPTTTGAARSISAVLPELDGRLEAVSIRVPTPDVSLADLTLRLARSAGADEVNATLRRAAEGRLRGILSYTELPLVSADYVGCPLSSVIDGLSTRVAGKGLLKLLAWYDNEWGYSNRLVELAQMIHRLEARSRAAPV